MAGLGWSGSYGATGASDVLEKILKEQELRKQLAFENQLKTRAADLADVREQEAHADRMDRNAAYAAQTHRATQDKTVADAQRIMGDMLPGSRVAGGSQTYKTLDAGGYGGSAFLDPEKTLASRQTDPGATPTPSADTAAASPSPMLTGQLRASSPQPTGDFLSRGTAKQDLGYQRVGATYDSNRIREDLGGEANRIREGLGSEGNRIRESLGTEGNRIRESLGNQTDATRNRLGDQTDATRGRLGDQSDATRGRLGDQTDATRNRLGDQADVTRQAGIDARQAAAEAAAERQGTQRGTNSYNRENTQIENMRKPIVPAMDRLSRLVSSLDAGSAVADSVVIPEFVIAMAGGQGSGLRINNAEIDRTAGARSVWTSLTAKLSQWDPRNPDKVLNIQPIERKAMHDLIRVVHEKGAQKLAILNQAEQDLIDTPQDVAAQRNITLRAKQAMDALDGPQERPATAQRPQTFGAAPAPRPSAPAGPGPNRDSMMFSGRGAAPPPAPQQQAAPATPAAQPPGAGTGRAPTNPRVGDFFTFPNGNRGRWDGTGWELVQ